MLVASDFREVESEGYRPLDEAGLRQYLARREDLAAFLGGQSHTWQAREFGDGNLNLVFLVTGQTRSLIVKQALPYVRMIGDSWPLPLQRSNFERQALAEQTRWAAKRVPEVYHADADMALIVMEYLTPHRVLRKGLIVGEQYPMLARHLGEYLARNLFFSSDLHLSADAKRLSAQRFAGNTEMSRITENLVFDEPYFDAPLNRHTAPMLDDIALAFRSDAALKVAVQELKSVFLNQPECLLHGDLHTGSIMATAQDTRVIDPEFATYGPMGFDLGMLLANLLMAYLAQSGHGPADHKRRGQCAHLREQIHLLWDAFSCELHALWTARPVGESQSALFNRRLSLDSPAFERVALDSLLAKIWIQAVGFAGCEMIRRILGLAHVEDFESILVPSVRAAREIRTLQLARDILMRRQHYFSTDALLAAAAAP